MLEKVVLPVGPAGHAGDVLGEVGNDGGPGFADRLEARAVVALAQFGDAVAALGGDEGHVVGDGDAVGDEAVPEGVGVLAGDERDFGSLAQPTDGAVDDLSIAERADGALAAAPRGEPGGEVGLDGDETIAGLVLFADFDDGVLPVDVFPVERRFPFVFVADDLGPAQPGEAGDAKGRDEVADVFPVGMFFAIDWAAGLGKDVAELVRGVDGRGLALDLGAFDFFGGRAQGLGEDVVLAREIEEGDELVAQFAAPAQSDWHGSEPFGHGQGGGLRQWCGEARGEFFEIILEEIGVVIGDATTAHIGEVKADDLGARGVGEGVIVLAVNAARVEDSSGTAGESRGLDEEARGLIEREVERGEDGDGHRSHAAIVGGEILRRRFGVEDFRGDRVEFAAQTLNFRPLDHDACAPWRRVVGKRESAVAQFHDRDAESAVLEEFRDAGRHGRALVISSVSALRRCAWATRALGRRNGFLSGSASEGF